MRPRGIAAWAVVLRAVAVRAVVVRAVAASALAVCAVAACSSTTDSLGYNGAGGTKLRPVTGPTSYPNVFRDVLGQSDADIKEKIDSSFNQLFHGDSGLQAIYFTNGDDQAYIRDLYHDDIRTEGIGYGMLICVQLNKRDEFDRLWRYAKANMQVQSGPAAGYFNNSACDAAPVTKTTCADPFGLQQMVMALLFAHNRWSGMTATVDYAAEVTALFNLMRHKLEETDGGIVDGDIADGANDTFDDKTALAFDLPRQTDPPRTRPSIEMPAYYDLWAQATGDRFWRRAASAARGYWPLSAHPKTGLVPVASDFEGTPIAGLEMFKQEAYRTQINVVIDAIWSGASTSGTSTAPGVDETSWGVDENNKLLQFFLSQGINGYGSQFSLDGKSVLDSTHDPALVAANGVSAVIATIDQRETFIAQLYNMPTPIGSLRYFQGLLYMLGLLIGAGQFVVY